MGPEKTIDRSRVVLIFYFKTVIVIYGRKKITLYSQYMGDTVCQDYCDVTYPT